MLSIERRDWGEVAGGQRVELYTLTEGDIVASVSTLGATLISLHTPDKDGRVEDIVLGFDTPSEYAQPGPYFGCVVGRVANRIAKGKFALDGREYTLAVNNGPNHLHGGLQGFDKRVWGAEEVSGGVRFTLTSADMEEGYPGAVTVSANITPKHQSLNLKPSTLNPKPQALTPKRNPPTSESRTINPELSTLNPRPYPLNPEP
jgi:aldose 1-epimerase